jgi:hypothetical protein
MQMMPDRGANRTSSVLRPINAMIRHHLHSKVDGVKCVRTTTQRPEIFESGFSRVSIKENFCIFEKINFLKFFLKLIFFLNWPM